MGGILTGAAQTLTPQNNFNVNNQQEIANYNQNQQQFGQNIGNQNALAQQLLAQSQGQGPNIAQAQLQSATDQNLKQSAGLIASQKGINPGLAAKQVADQNAAIGQQAAQQSGQLRLQSQLGAESALGQQYGNIGNELNNNSQVAMSGVNAGNSTNAAIAGQNVAANQQTAGGILGGLSGSAGQIGNSIGGALTSIGLAHGGVVHPLATALMRHYASGGSVSSYADPDNFFDLDNPSSLDSAPSGNPSKTFFNNPNKSGQTASDQIAKAMAQQAGMQSMPSGVPQGEFDFNGQGSTLTNLITGIQQGLNPTPNADKLVAQAVSPQVNYSLGATPPDQLVSVTPTSADGIATGSQYQFQPKYSQGGKVPAMVSPGEVVETPEKLKEVEAGANPLKVGEKFKGKANVAGDSPKNDTIPKDLEADSIVIPRSHTGSVGAAMAFLQNELAKQKSQPKSNFDDGGTAGDSGDDQAAAAPDQNSVLAQGMSRLKYNDSPPAQDEPSTLDQITAGYKQAINNPTPMQPSSGFKSMSDMAANPAAGNQPDQSQGEQNQQAPGVTQAQGMQMGQNNPFNGPLSKQQDLIKQQGQLEAVQAAHQSQAWDTFLNQQAEQDRLSTQIYAQRNRELDQLHAAITNTNIDPNRFYNNMSTGEKIGTAIGMILGGAGAAHGGQNWAAINLNKSIDEDIDAQKANVGIKTTLYSENLKRFGDDRAADLATRQQQLTVAQAQMAKQAALDGGQLALNRAAQASNAIALKKVELGMQLAQYQTKQALFGAGRGPNEEGGVDAKYEGYLRSLPKDQQTPLAKVTMNGQQRLYPVADEETAKNMAKVEPLYQSINSDLKELQGLPDLATKLPGEAKAKADVLRARLIENIARAGSMQLGAVRVPEQAVHLTEGTLGNLGSLTDINARNKINQYAASMRRDLENTRRQNLIGYKGRQTIDETPGHR